MSPTSALRAAMLAFVVSAACQAASSDSAKSSANNLALDEYNLIAQAHKAALSGNEKALDSLLGSPWKLSKKESPSLVLARRAAAVCGWLRNDSQYALAAKIAKRVVEKVSTLKETNDFERSERCYWEARLESENLNNKARALELLKEADRLNPDDELILDEIVLMIGAIIRSRN